MLDPGPGVYTVANPSSWYNGFVSKLDSDGNFAWARGINADYSTVIGAAIDGSGNLYVSGDFQGMISLELLQAGYYANLERYPFKNPARGGLDWNGMGRGCNTLTGWFAVDAVTYTGVTLTSIDLRFEQQESGSHAKEEQRRHAASGFGNLKIKQGCEQNHERA